MADLLAKFDMLKLVAICFALDFKFESMSWRLCISLSVLHKSNTNLSMHKLWSGLMYRHRFMKFFVKEIISFGGMEIL
jgi:hypothetical protein